MNSERKLPEFYHVYYCKRAGRKRTNHLAREDTSLGSMEMGPAGKREERLYLAQPLSVP